MSRGNETRAEILAALFGAMRTASANGVLLSQTVAERVGLNSTDMECLDLLGREGAVTAGRLAELTNLTTGAITGVIDRLEKAGYVRRVPNPRDRRSVVVEPLMEKVEREIGPFYASIGRAMEELGTHYSDAELVLLRDFVLRLNELSREEIAKLRGEASAGE
jgi:DNA-binding MarR family transcriptional regulator